MISLMQVLKNIKINLNSLKNMIVNYYILKSSVNTKYNKLEYSKNLTSEQYFNNEQYECYGFGTN